MDLRGTLRDPFGGQCDLEAKLLRCVGEPDLRLTEDALRILRGLRFAAVLGFRMEPDTAAALHRHRKLLRDIAAERIRMELVKLLCGTGAAEVLREYPDVVGVFWPELLPLVGFDQRNRHHCYDIWEHTLSSLESVPPDPVLRLTMAYRRGQPFHKNPLRSCPLLDNPDKLKELVETSCAHSTNPEMPEDVEDLTLKCETRARDWAPIAEQLWQESRKRSE